MKLVSCIVQWFVILILLPGIKVFIDAGIPILVSLHQDAATIAWLRILPWLLPLAWFAGTIIWLVQPSKPKYEQPNRIVKL
jgi:hypothetical protein